MKNIKSLVGLNVGETVFFANFNSEKLYKYEISEILSTRYFNLTSEKGGIHKNISVIDDGLFYKYNDAIKEYEFQNGIKKWYL